MHLCQCRNAWASVVVDCCHLQSQIALVIVSHKLVSVDLPLVDVTLTILDVPHSEIHTDQ